MHRPPLLRRSREGRVECELWKSCNDSFGLVLDYLKSARENGRERVVYFYSGGGEL